MNDERLETIVGAAIVAVALGFFGYAWKASGSTAALGGYRVSAQFDNIDGIAPGTDVRVAGIKVGSVTGTHLDPKSYQAKLDMQLAPDVQLADDTSAKITADGLLGGKFVKLEPGGSDAKLKDGSEITYTQGSVDMWGLISQAMFSKGGKSDAGSGSTPNP